MCTEVIYVSCEDITRSNMYEEKENYCRANPSNCLKNIHRNKYAGINIKRNVSR